MSRRGNCRDNAVAENLWCHGSKDGLSQLEFEKQFIFQQQSIWKTKGDSVYSVSSIQAESILATKHLSRKPFADKRVY